MNIPWVGLLAGFIATAPMTVLMLILFRRLPRQEKQPLPPHKITMAAAGALGIAHRIDKSERTALTLIAHFAYGTVMGGIYSLLAVKVPGAPLLTGILFGLFVWASSYLVVMPALGFLRSAVYHPLRRNILMISAHLVWGGVLGLTVHWLMG